MGEDSRAPIVATAIRGQKSGSSFEEEEEALIPKPTMLFRRRAWGKRGGEDCTFLLSLYGGNCRFCTLFSRLSPPRRSFQACNDAKKNGGSRRRLLMAEDCLGSDGEDGMRGVALGRCTQQQLHLARSFRRSPFVRTRLRVAKRGEKRLHRSGPASRLVTTVREAAGRALESSTDSGRVVYSKGRSGRKEAGPGKIRHHGQAGNVEFGTKREGPKGNDGRRGSGRRRRRGICRISRITGENTSPIYVPLYRQ